MAGGKPLQPAEANGLYRLRNSVSAVKRVVIIAAPVILPKQKAGN